MTVSNAENIQDSGIIINDSGDFSAVELTTKGDLLGYSTDYTRIGVGTDGQALVSDSTQASGLNYSTVTSSGAIIFIESQTASGSASLDFSTLDSSTYAYFIFTFSNIRPSSASSTQFRSRIGFNSGATWHGAYFYNWGFLNSGTINIGSSTSTAFGLISPYSQSNNNDGLSGKAYCFIETNPSSNIQTSILSDLTLIINDNPKRIFSGYRVRGSSALVNAIQFYMSSGNIATGTIKLYGVKNS